MIYLLAFFFCKFAFIRTVEELPIEQLNSNDSKDELEQDVHNENIDDILQWVDHTIKHCLQLGHTFDGFEWTQHSQNSEGFNSRQVLSCFASTVNIIRRYQHINRNSKYGGILNSKQ